MPKGACHLPRHKTMWMGPFPVRVKYNISFKLCYNKRKYKEQGETMIKRERVDFENFNDRISQLKNSLKYFGNKITALYLFGSCHTGRAGVLSDIDIAVLFDEALNDIEIEDLENNLYIILTKILETDEIDFIVLNKAPLSIQYGVLKDKEILYYTNKSKAVDFQCRVISEYLDFKPTRDEINKTFLKFMVEGGRNIRG